MKTAFCAVFLAICLCAVSSQKNPTGVKADRIKLGLYFVYDQEFSTRGIFKVNDSYTDYFTVLTNAAQAYFKQLHNLKVLLTVVGSSKLKERQEIDYVSKESPKVVDAVKTLENLDRVFTWNETLPPDADVVFFATGFNIKTRESEMTGEWYGLAAPRTICFGNASLGIIHDDGATFNGAHLVALQVALLLGANKHNGRYRECPHENGYLTSSITGGDSPILSDCNSGSIWDFYMKIIGKYRRRICWNDWPRARRNNTDLPADFYKKKNCNICELQGEMHEGFQCTGSGSTETNGACKACCKSTGQNCEVNMPDGTPCGGHGICIYGQCV